MAHAERVERVDEKNVAVGGGFGVYHLLEQFELNRRTGEALDAVSAAHVNQQMWRGVRRGFIC